MRTLPLVLLAAGCLPEPHSLSSSVDVDLPEAPVQVQVDDALLRGGVVWTDASTGLVSIVLTESEDGCAQLTEGMLAELALAEGDDVFREGVPDMASTTLTLQVETPWQIMSARPFPHGFTEGTFSAFVERGAGDAFWQVSEEGALVLSTGVDHAFGRFEIEVEGELVWGWFDVDACPQYEAARARVEEARCAF